jgi:hypothetical protein
VNECNHAVAGSCAKCEPCGVCGRPKGDPHRYPVAGECTAPDSSDYTVSLQCLSIALRKAQDDVKAAEERGRRRGVEEAAKICDAERDAAWKSSREADARGNHRVGAADAITASTAQRLGEQILALAPRDSAPVCDNCKRAAKAKDGRTDRGVTIGPCYCDTLRAPRDSGTEGQR